MKTLRVHQWFAEQAAATPDRAAIEYRGRSLTYRELQQRSNAIAAILGARGAQRGDRVAILADDPTDVIATILAALAAGLVFVPLDARIPDAQLRVMVAEAAVDWFVLDSRFVETVGRIAPGAPGPHLVTLDRDAVGVGASAAPVAIDRPADDCCYIYFTSGSTGRPKGIAGRLKAIDHFIRWELETFGLGEGVRVSHLTTPSFDASLRDIFVPLCAGGTICAPESSDVKLDAPRLIRWIDEARIEVLHCVPSVFRSMLNEGLDANAFGALRHVLMAGEALLPSDVRRWMNVFGDRIALVNLYGPSETTMIKFFHRVTSGDADRRSVPIGVPIQGAAALVVDEHGRPSPRGVVGEIWIRTPYRSLGYFRRDDLTAQAFVPNPFGADLNDLVYKTGDLGRVLPDGSYELVGRKDHQVKIRGERVELGAIELALRAHPDVVDAAVIDREDTAGFKYLGAYVALRDGAPTPDLRAFLGRDLPAVMVPSTVIVMPHLPRTVTGKIDRQALPADAAPRREIAIDDAPRTPVEEQLAALFAEVLGVSRLGIHESFFDLGGHSLLATQLVSRIRRVLEVPLPVRALFDAPSVAGIAKHVEAALWAAARPAAAGAATVELEI